MSTVTNGLPNSTPNPMSGSKSGTGDPLNNGGAQASHQEFPRWLALAMAIPSALALAISVYLAYAAFTMSDVAGCSGGGIFDCGHVLHSKWSKLFGVPVSVFAITAHLFVVGGLFVTQQRRLTLRTRSIATAIVLTAAVSAAAAACWFVALQVLVLNHLCGYCMAAHACGLTIAVLAIWKLPVPQHQAIKMAMIGIAGVSGMAVIQVGAQEPARFIIEQHTVVPALEASFQRPAKSVNSNALDGSELFDAPFDDSDNSEDLFAPPVEDDQASATGSEKTRANRHQNNYALSSILSLSSAMTSMLVLQDPQPEVEQPEPAKPRLVSISGGTVKLNPKQWPLVGDPDAKYIFVEMFDYTCSHCRSTNQALETAKKTLGKDLAVVVLPVPMNRLCNKTVTKDSHEHLEACELSKLAIAIWRIDPEKFTLFHSWLFEGEKAPAYGIALEKAREWVGAEKLDKELAKTICGKFVERNVQLYQRVGAGPIPKLMFERTSIVGEFTSGETLTNLIRQYTSAP